jgi:hypothetical protein
MFRQAVTMQLSAANLLIASQRIARGVQPPPRDAQAQFAAALAKEKSAITATSFEPIEFTQGASEPSPAPATPPRPATYSQTGSLGAHVDIRV